MEFLPISSYKVLKSFPGFHHKDAFFYTISKRGAEFAILGIKKLGEDTCEISLCVYPQHRGVFSTKETVMAILNFPSSLKIKKVLISTLEKSISTLMHSLERFGMKYLFEKNQKEWFLWEITI